MFHVELFSSSISSGATTFAQINYVKTDAVLPPLNNGMQVSSQLPYFLFAAGIGAHQVDVRIQATSILPLPYPTFNPNNRGTAAESPPRTWDFSQYPIPLRPTEEFDIYATQNAGSGETQYVLCGFTDNQPVAAPVPASMITPNGTGRFTTVHATSATTLTAGAWTACQLTFDQALPPGMYAVVGCRAFSATAYFFRFFPAQGPVWRPGGVAVQAYDQMDPYNQRYINSFNRLVSQWGQWLQFYQNVPPQIEMFATSADTSEEFWIDLIKISDVVTSGP